jgi:hypothetical protein
MAGSTIRRMGWLIACAFLCTSCITRTTYPVVKPLSPKAPSRITNRPVKAENPPTFRWTVSGPPAPGTSYDLIVYEAVYNPDYHRNRQPEWSRGQTVYYREDLKDTEHTPPSPLVPNVIPGQPYANRAYIWSVRTRSGSRLSAWSDYDYWFLSVVPIPGFLGFERIYDKQFLIWVTR